MLLRTRILLGYGYLVALLIIGAVGAAIGFQRLGTNIGRLLADNFVSVRASMDMLEALERQDSALLTLLLPGEESRASLDESETSFQRAFERARANVTVAGEAGILEQIDLRFELYRAARDSLLAARPERPLLAYDRSTYPRFEAVKSSVLALLDVNHQAMVEADREAERIASAHAAAHASLAALALLSLGFVAQLMRREIFARLAELRNVAQAVASGDLRRRAPVERRDELGMVGEQLNALLDHQHQLKNALGTRLNHFRQLVLALLEDRTAPSVLVSMSGEVMASTIGEREAMLIAARVAAPEAGGGAPVPPPEKRETVIDGKTVEVRPLLLGGSRPVAWLASVERRG